MAKEPDAPPTGLPVEARRRGGMDTLFSAAWFDEKEGEGAAEGDPAAVVAARRPAAAVGPKRADPLVISVAVLAGLGAMGFAFVSVMMAGAVAYLWTLAG